MTTTTKKPKIKTKATKQAPRIKPATPTTPPIPKVFYDRSRRIFLHLTNEDGFNRYLTILDEQVQVVKLQHGAPVRDDKGHLPEDTTHVDELLIYEDHAIEEAAAKFYASYLPKSPAAERELCIILGKPVPEIPEKIQKVRRAAGERLKAARPQLAKPGDDSMVKLEPKATANDADTARSKMVLELLGKAKGKHLTVAQLSEAVGKPVGAAVAKLAAAGLVTVTKN